MTRFPFSSFLLFLSSPSRLSLTSSASLYPSHCISSHSTPMTLHAIKTLFFFYFIDHIARRRMYINSLHTLLTRKRTKEGEGKQRKKLTKTCNFTISLFTLATHTHTRHIVYFKCDRATNIHFPFRCMMISFENEQVRIPKSKSPSRICTLHTLDHLTLPRESLLLRSLPLSSRSSSFSNLPVLGSSRSGRPIGRVEILLFGPSMFMFGMMDPACG